MRDDPLRKSRRGRRVVRAGVPDLWKTDGSSDSSSRAECRRSVLGLLSLPACRGTRDYGSPDDSPVTAPTVQMSTNEEAGALGGAPPNCPEPDCGAPMVLKVARRGRNAGSTFWSCSRYPDCRGIRQNESSIDVSSTPANPLQAAVRRRVLKAQKPKPAPRRARRPPTR